LRTRRARRWSFPLLFLCDYFSTFDFFVILLPLFFITWHGFLSVDRPSFLRLGVSREPLSRMFLEEHLREDFKIALLWQFTLSFQYHLNHNSAFPLLLPVFDDFRGRLKNKAQPQSWCFNNVDHYRLFLGFYCQCLSSMDEMDFLEIPCEVFGMKGMTKRMMVLFLEEVEFSCW
jgi:hypothetical protein